MPATFAAALRDLGATGRQIIGLAAPIGEPVDAFLDRLPAPQVRAPTINITINLTTAPEENPWPIQ